MSHITCIDYCEVNCKIHDVLGQLRYKSQVPWRALL
uniref:Uncharacterized protein n=1 Tax=Ciona intestinalis TaxID=7719 RepID=H2XUF1_CIOIN